MFRFLRRLMFLRARFAMRHGHAMHHRRRWHKMAVATAACGACLASGAAMAHPPRGPGGPDGHGHAMMAEHAGVWLDGLLDEIGATPAQIATAHAARDEAFAALHKGHEARRDEMDAALKIFAADSIDEKALTALRQRFQANHQAVEQVVIAGVAKLHGQLDATQRQKLVAALKDFRPEARGGLHAAMAKRMMAGRIAHVLEKIKADDQQKATVRGAADKLGKAMEAQTGTRQALFDEAVTLLSQAKIDPAKLQALTARHEAARVAMGDQFVQAAREIHAALRPEQRAAVVAAVKERMGRFDGP